MQHFDPLFSLKKVKKGFFRPQMLALPMHSSVESFTRETLRLLGLENEAEVHEAAAWRHNISDGALAHKGVLVPKLRVDERRMGLAGRTLLVLGSSVPTSKAEGPRQLPASELSSGDIVEVRGKQPDERLQGLLYRTSRYQLTVALEPEAAAQPLSEPLAVLKLADETTYKRQRVGMHALNSCTLPLGRTDGSFDPSPAAKVRDVAFGVSPPQQLTVAPRTADASRLTNEEVSAMEAEMKAGAALNEGQEAAIDFAMRCASIACIHGPPGTGKTTTVVELIRRLVLLGGARVLACAPSCDFASRRPHPHASCLALTILPGTGMWLRII